MSFLWGESDTRPAVEGRSGGICEACGAARATDKHHRIPRSLGGGWHPSNILDLCRICHDWLEEGKNRGEARSKGLLLNSTDDPRAVPITRFTGITTFLSDDITPPLKRKRRPPSAPMQISKRRGR